MTLAAWRTATRNIYRNRGRLDRRLDRRLDKKTGIYIIRIFRSFLGIVSARFQMVVIGRPKAYAKDINIKPIHPHPRPFP